jgi:uncharacterized membrane protein
LRRGYALFWRRYFARYYTLRWIARNIAAAISILVVAFTILAAILVPAVQRTVEPFFMSGDQLAILRNLLVALGGALIGATAISFSVVMFAVQINFARTPHGLFRKLSTDLKLLGAFIATFLLAVGVAALSLIPDASQAGAAIVAAGV